MNSIFMDKVLRLILEETKPYLEIPGVNEFISGFEAQLGDESSVYEMRNKTASTDSASKDHPQSFNNEQSAQLMSAPTEQTPSVIETSNNASFPTDNSDDAAFLRTICGQINSHLDTIQTRIDQDRKNEGITGFIYRKTIGQVLPARLRSYRDTLKKLIKIFKLLYEQYKKSKLIDFPVEHMTGEQVVLAVLAYYRAIKNDRSESHGSSFGDKLVVAATYNENTSDRKDNLCREIEQDITTIKSLPRVRASLLKLKTKPVFNILTDASYDHIDSTVLNQIAMFLSEYVLDRDREVVDGTIIHNVASLTDLFSVAHNDIKEIIAGNTPSILGPILTIEQRANTSELPYPSIFTMMVVRLTQLRASIYFECAKVKFVGVVDLQQNFTESVRSICVKPINRLIEHWADKIKIENVNGERLSDDEIRLNALCCFIDSYDENAAKKVSGASTLNGNDKKIISDFYAKIKAEIYGIIEAIRKQQLIDIPIAHLKQKGLLRLTLAMMNYRLDHEFIKKYKSVFEKLAGFIKSNQLREDKLLIMDEIEDLLGMLNHYFNSPNEACDQNYIMNRLYSVLLHSLGHREFKIGGGTTILGVPIFYSPKLRDAIKLGKRQITRLLSGRLTAAALDRPEHRSITSKVFNNVEIQDNKNSLKDSQKDEPHPTSPVLVRSPLPHTPSM